MIKTRHRRRRSFRHFIQFQVSWIIRRVTSCQIHGKTFAIKWIFNFSKSNFAFQLAPPHSFPESPAQFDFEIHEVPFGLFKWQRRLRRQQSTCKMIWKMSTHIRNQNQNQHDNGQMQKKRKIRFAERRVRLAIDGHRVRCLDRAWILGCARSCPNIEWWEIGARCWGNIKRWRICEVSAACCRRVSTRERNENIYFSSIINRISVSISILPHLTLPYLLLIHHLRPT